MKLVREYWAIDVENDKRAGDFAGYGIVCDKGHDFIAPDKVCNCPDAQIVLWELKKYGFYTYDDYATLTQARRLGLVND